MRQYRQEVEAVQLRPDTMREILTWLKPGADWVSASWDPLEIVLAGGGVAREDDVIVKCGGYCRALPWDDFLAQYTPIEEGESE